jgi:NADH:ubiquinone oxidoreductase subunit 4 (subunit M)
MILAGLLLKVGTYGMIRFLLPSFNQANTFFNPIIQAILLVGLLYASINTLRQVDLKKLIAYMSIAHMNLSLIGLLTLNLWGTVGAILTSLSHGLVSALFFYLIGSLYERYHTRISSYYGGLISTMPTLAILIILAAIANISLPVTFNFICEYLVLLGIVAYSPFMLLGIAISLVVTAATTITIVSKILMSGIKYTNLYVYSDLSRREYIIASSLLVWVFYFGLYPSILIDLILVCSNVLILPYY